MSDLLRTISPGAPCERFRRLLAHPEPTVIPGCYDALGARLIEQAGFDAVYVTGFGTAASMLGRPDVGLVGFNEMVDNVRRIVRATTLPVIADADTGYGNAINVIRTVQEYEQAGAAGLHLEDQVLPKRCGHMDGKEVVPAGEFVAKIEAAVAARSNPAFTVIARTDARGPLGLDEALRRGQAAREAGADVLFVEAPQDDAELRRVAETFSDVPLLFNWVEGGKTPAHSFDQIRELGFALVITPISTLLAATRAIQQELADLRAAGTPPASDVRASSFDEFTALIGLPEIAELDQRFS